MADLTKRLNVRGERERERERERVCVSVCACVRVGARQCMHKGPEEERREGERCSLMVRMFGLRNV